MDYFKKVKEYSSQVRTPAYIVDESLLKKNLQILKGLGERTGAHILLAQKAFSMYGTYPLIGQFLDGTTASGLFEAKLGYEEMKEKEVHVYSPAYKEEDMEEILGLCDHIIFNSIKQWLKYKNKIQEYNQKSIKKVSPGLRVNPQYAEIETDIYNPCIVGSRLGTTKEQISISDFEGLEGIHFHTMCEQNSDVLDRTLCKVEEQFSEYLKIVKWINFGGGHHITKENYNIELLESCINRIKNKYELEVYLEPGEAVALNSGFLVGRVLDIVENGMKIVILDVSASCHMPDVLEMPYRPMIIDGGEPNEKEFTYRISAPTCLAGDVIGDYSFDYPLKEGDKLIFCDMAIYSMVKNNTFNGMPLPDILFYHEDGSMETIKQFHYEDFKRRL